MQVQAGDNRPGQGPLNVPGERLVSMQERVAHRAKLNRVSGVERMPKYNGLIAVGASGNHIYGSSSKFLDLLKVAPGVLRQVVVALGTKGGFLPAGQLNEIRDALLETVRAYAGEHLPLDRRS